MSGDDTGGVEGGVFTRLFREHYHDVRRYALRRLGPDSADDVAAETFSVAWRRFDRMPREEPLPWLYGVARNITRARMREMRREGRLTALDTDPGTPDPTGTVVDRESALLVIGRLSDTDRELVMLLAWEGLEIQEAARALGCSTPTARVRLYRARKRIERLLEHPPPRPAPTPHAVRPVLKEKS